MCLAPSGATGRAPPLLWVLLAGETQEPGAIGRKHGNSVQIIKKHYKQVVSNSAVKEYWSIVPGYDGQGVAKELPSKEDIRKARGKRIAEALKRAS